jgi:putative PIN family toxin of toxin-antitoxin system
LRVVLDTNVLMSGIFFGGLPGEILQAWSAGRLILLFSPEIFQEYHRVGERLSEQYGDLELAPILTLLGTRGELVRSDASLQAGSRDPDDDKFLACAATGEAAALVSGDRDLLDLESWKDVPILTPRQFVDAHLSDSE